MKILKYTVLLLSSCLLHSLDAMNREIPKEFLEASYDEQIKMLAVHKEQLLKETKDADSFIYAVGYYNIYGPDYSQKVFQIASSAENVPFYNHLVKILREEASNPDHIGCFKAQINQVYEVMLAKDK